MLFGITIVVYAILLAAPGGPTARFANNPRVTEADREKFKKAWGLDQPVPVQYCRWMGICNPNGEGLGVFISDNGVPNFLPAAIGGGTNGILHGDFGISISTGEEVSTMIARAALPTLILAGTALVIWLLLRRPDRDRTRRSSATRCSTRRRRSSPTSGYAMPTFWLGIMLIFTFSGPGLNILPAGGMTGHAPLAAVRLRGVLGRTPRRTRSRRSWTWPSTCILPVFTLVVVNIAGDSRFVRASMLETLSQDFVRTAKSKGLRQPRRLVQARVPERDAAVHHQHRPGDPVPVHRAPS